MSNEEDIPDTKMTLQCRTPCDTPQSPLTVWRKLFVSAIVFLPIERVVGKPRDHVVADIHLSTMELNHGFPAHQTTGDRKRAHLHSVR